MAAAILMMNIPGTCGDCPCYQCNDFGDWCGVSNGPDMVSYDERPKNCPLVIVDDPVTEGQIKRLLNAEKGASTNDNPSNRKGC